MIRHTAVKYVHFILATAILDFWRMSTSRDTGSGTIKMFDLQKHGDSRWNFVAICSRTRNVPGGKIPPAAGKRRQKTAAGTRVKYITG